MFRDGPLRLSRPKIPSSVSLDDGNGYLRGTATITNASELDVRYDSPLDLGIVLMRPGTTHIVGSGGIQRPMLQGVHIAARGHHTFPAATQLVPCNAPGALEPGVYDARAGELFEPPNSDPSSWRVLYGPTARVTVTS